MKGLVPSIVTSSGKSRSPGPAAYTTRTDIGTGSPSFTIKHRYPNLSPERLDAPYRALPSMMGTGLQYSIKGAYKSPRRETVGYSYIPPAFGSDARGSTIHRKTRTRSPTITPGPGQYDPDPKFGSTTRGISMHGVRDRSPPITYGIPGPAKYSPSTLTVNKSAPAFSIGHRRPEKKIESTPGPGTYEDKDQMKPKALYGSFHGKFIPKEVPRSPGPACYDTTSHILANTPRVYMHGKPAAKVTNLLKKDETPGPSHYTPYKPMGSDARAATMHGIRDRTIEVMNRSPGPAEYSPDAGKTQTRSPSFTIKSGKYQPKQDRTGEYVNLGSTLDNPKTTLHVRPDAEIQYS